MGSTPTEKDSIADFVIHINHLDTTDNDNDSIGEKLLAHSFTCKPAEITSESKKFFDTIIEAQGPVSVITVLGESPEAACRAFLGIAENYCRGSESDLIKVDVNIDSNDLVKRLRRPLELRQYSHEESIYTGDQSQSGNEEDIQSANKDLLGVVLKGKCTLVLLIAGSWDGLSFSKAYFCSTSIVLAMNAASPNHDLSKHLEASIINTARIGHKKSDTDSDSDSDLDSSSGEEIVYPSTTNTGNAKVCRENNCNLAPRLIVWYFKDHLTPNSTIDKLNDLTRMLLATVTIFSSIECVIFADPPHAESDCDHSIIQCQHSSGNTSIQDLFYMPPKTGASQSASMSGQEVAFGIFGVIEAMEGVNDEPALCRMSDLVARHLRVEAVQEYDQQMKMQKENGNLKNVEEFHAIHLNHAKKAYESLTEDLKHGLGLTDDGIKSWIPGAANLVSASRERILSILDEDWREDNMRIAEMLWEYTFPRNKLLEDCGDVVSVIVNALATFCKEFKIQAQGRFVLRDLEIFVEGKAEWINDVFELSNLEIDLDKKRKDGLEELVQLAKDQHLQDFITLTEVSRTLSQTMDEELNLLTSVLDTHSDEVKGIMKEGMISTLQQMDRNLAECIHGMQHTKEKTWKQTYENTRILIQKIETDLDSIIAANIKSKANMKEINNSSSSFWDKFGQITIGAFMTVAGVALTACTGGAAGVVGASLLSAGINCTMSSSESWDEFGITLGVGLASGLLSAGVGGVAGAATKTVAQNVTKNEVTKVAITSGVTTASGCASGVLSQTIDNACHDRPVEDGMAAAAAMGAMCGLTSGVVSGARASHSATKDTRKMTNLIDADNTAKNATRNQFTNPNLINDKRISEINNARQGIMETPKSFHPFRRMAMIKSGTKNVLINVGTGMAEGAASGALGAVIEGQDISDGSLQGLIYGGVGGAAAGAAEGGREICKLKRDRKKLDEAVRSGYMTNSDPNAPESYQFQQQTSFYVDGTAKNVSNDHRNIHVSGSIDDHELKARAHQGRNCKKKWERPFNHSKTNKASAFHDFGSMEQAQQQAENLNMFLPEQAGPNPVPLENLPTLKREIPRYPWYSPKMLRNFGRDRYAWGYSFECYDGRNIRKIDNIKEAKVASERNTTAFPVTPNYRKMRKSSYMKYRYDKLLDVTFVDVPQRDVQHSVIHNQIRQVINDDEKV